MSTSKYDKRFDGMPRDELEAVASIALEASEALAEANRKLDSCVQRCARILSARAQRCNRPGIHLLGWHCSECGAFNGAEKEVLKACRACATAIPQGIEEELRK